MSGYIKIFEKIRKRKKAVYVKKGRADWNEVGEEFRGLVKEALKEAKQSIKEKKKTKKKR